MKPMGPIPAWFAEEEGMLLIGGCGAASLVDEAGDTPLFVYDMGFIEAQVRRFREAIPKRIDLHYAIKANPHPALLQAVAPLVDGLDVASAGELDKALRVKPAGAISFAGPGKRDAELVAAITAGATLNVESEGEAARALAIGGRLGTAPRLAVRVNPDM
jgi:diaminopimelate decarboxylase